MRNVFSSRGEGGGRYLYALKIQFEQLFDAINWVGGGGGEFEDGPSFIRTMYSTVYLVWYHVTLTCHRTSLEHRGTRLTLDTVTNTHSQHTIQTH